MKIHNLSETPSIVNNFMSQLRDKQLQKDSMRFRRNVERIGEIMSYEMSKFLDFQYHDVITPLGICKTPVLTDNIVICSVLRAGIPLHQGVLNYFDKAENAFISAYRKSNKDGSFDIRVEYLASPSIDGKTLLLVDPMLATGKSLLSAYKTLIYNGVPGKVHIASVIASKQGIEYLNEYFDDEIHFWTADIDPELDSHSYIVPGLGDAGDLAFGPKI